MIEPGLLDGIPALADVPTASRSALAERARETTFEADERLEPLLNPPSRLLFLLEGLAKMVGVSANGLERIVYVFRPGDITGARALIEEGREAAYEIVAMEPVRALAVSRRDFLAVAGSHPELIVSVTREFTRRLERLAERMLSAMSAEVPVRLSELLLDFAAGGDGVFVPLTHPLTHSSMAQIIGASRPHTSTVLRDLEEAGAVRRKSRRGLLVSPARLREISDRGTVTTARTGE